MDMIEIDVKASVNTDNDYIRIEFRDGSFLCLLRDSGGDRGIRDIAYIKPSAGMAQLFVRGVKVEV